jgi:hypothetical protein
LIIPSENSHVVTIHSSLRGALLLFQGVAHYGVNDSSGNQPRMNEGNEVSGKALRVLRFFVVDFHCLSRVAHRDVNDSFSS